MPEHIIEEQVLPALRALTAELPATEARLNAKFDSMTSDMARHRTFMRWTLVALAVFVLLLGASGAMALRNTDQQQEHAAMVACTASNEVRLGFLRFVDTILVPPQTPLAPDATPEQRETFERRARNRDEYIREAHEDFALLDCG